MLAINLFIFLYYFIVSIEQRFAASNDFYAAIHLIVTLRLHFGIFQYPKIGHPEINSDARKVVNIDGSSSQLVEQSNPNKKSQ